jgi:hypothetical protein
MTIQTTIQNVKSNKLLRGAKLQYFLMDHEQDVSKNTSRSTCIRILEQMLTANPNLITEIRPENGGYAQLAEFILR